MKRPNRDILFIAVEAEKMSDGMARTCKHGHSRKMGCVCWDQEALELFAGAEQQQASNTADRRKGPLCSACKAPMVYLADDHSGQGGPPADTWLCSRVSCGRTQSGEETKMGGGCDYERPKTVPVEKYDKLGRQLQALQSAIERLAAQAFLKGDDRLANDLRDALKAVGDEK